MRKATIIHYDDVDVRKIVGDELEKAKEAWLKEFIDVVGKFKDDVMTRLDKVMGELQDKREEQTLHQGQHDEISETLEKYDLKIKKLEHPTL